MNNKVFYGEYTLEHWIDLMLTGNIVLPWYQRSFVWDKLQIENLIKTLDNNQFIPPIIIGAVKEDNQWKNYILDGQQRLTSILFAKCNKYIDKNEYTSQKPNTEIEQIADDIAEEEENDIDTKIKMIRWNFNEIIRSRKIDTQELASPFYKRLFDNQKKVKFFKEHFLGFAFIKPDNSVGDEEQSKFYTETFRNINVGGTKLTRLESRKSFYFLKKELKDFFVPVFLDAIKVETSSKESGLIDFIKYLSILSQYRGENGYLVKYGGRDWEKNENYYQKYIMAVVDHNLDNELGFDLTYPELPYNDARMKNLEDAITQLHIPETFISIIEMDMYFFGLVNEIVFLDNKLDYARREALKNELDAKIIELKATEKHKENPHALKYLKERITSSIAIYENYKA